MPWDGLYPLPFLLACRLRRRRLDLQPAEPVEENRHAAKVGVARQADRVVGRATIGAAVAVRRLVC